MGQQIETLARFAAETRSESLPPLALERAKMIVASTLASASRGIDIASVQAIRRLEHSLSPNGGPCALWLTPGSLPPDRAARVNAVASDAAASDDSDLRNIIHTGTPVCASITARWLLTV